MSTINNNYDVLASAIRAIRNGYPTSPEEEDALQGLQERVDAAFASNEVPYWRDQEFWIRLQEAKAYRSYCKICDEVKNNPNAPGIMRDIALGNYTQLLNNPWGPAASQFKRYQSEPLNSRLSDPYMFRQAPDHGRLLMKVDGMWQAYPVAGDAYRGWASGAVPIEVLANKSLEISEKQEVAIESKIEMGLNERYDNLNERSFGMKSY